jgi:hypothetical protein
VSTGDFPKVLLSKKMIGFSGSNGNDEFMCTTSPECREGYMQAALGLSRQELEHIEKILGVWAFQAQKRYFAEAHQATRGLDVTSCAEPQPEVLQKLSDMLQEYESLRIQSERVRDAVKLFDTVVVPK